MALVRYALITSLTLATVLAACGDDDPPITGNDGGAEDAGTGGADAEVDPEELIDAGPPAELPAVDSSECMDSNAEAFTPYEEADCESRGEDGDGNPICGSCWSQSSAAVEGNCAGFYCNWTEIAVQCQTERPVGACKTEADLELGCDSSIQNAVAECARDAQGMVISMGVDDDGTPNFSQEDARAYTKACTREELPQVISPDCLNCYVDSAECARDNCLTTCLAGDTEACDQCREEKGCTPAFFKCTGFPDPQLINPDGSAR